MYFKVASKLGADATYLVKSTLGHRNSVDDLKEMSKNIVSLFKGSSNADATIECCGAASR